MAFELAYDLSIAVDNEVVFVKSDDWHRKVRVLITECQEEHGSLSFTGHSLGSSYPPIKAAKKDEIPVVVKGRFQRQGDKLVGELTPA
ncbi:MAG TPA: hypothetical protein VNN09_13975 [Candidatus Competibacteraceae bacterium]|nr:hypothetical protein [Candidatus Competibacteraceae bacterium]